jgi:carbonic anhydrase
MKGLKRFVIIAVVLLLPFAVAGGLYAESEGHHEVHWSYEGAGGPEHWGELKSDYALCREGKSQSPIDITDAVKAMPAPVEIHYAGTPLKIINNGHSIQVNYEKGSYIVVGGKKYELLQFHVHSPSEHQVNGKAYAMCAHLVHKDESGKLAVIAVLMEKGKENKFIDTLWSHLPKDEGKELFAKDVIINVEDLLPASKGYYNYSGSLTTPPCTEGVNWIVLKTPVTVSGDQVLKFTSIFKKSVRPVQPLNGRVVTVNE